VQVKLLRALEERTIRRVGDTRPINVDVRLISATNRDVKALVANGRMREDFYYRIRVFEIGMPPLRERREDIATLASHFAAKLGAGRDRAIDAIDAAALRALLDHDWPGNVRELKNAVEHALVTATAGRIRKVDLPAEMREPARPRRRSEPRAPDEEREQIQLALDRTGGNRADAARALGISRVTLWKRMRRLGIEPS
jgi:DNA-binding NtrC family response regulator